MDVGDGSALYPKANPCHSNTFHDTRHIDRTFHRRQQQSAVRLYGRLQRRPNGQGAQHGGQAFRREAGRPDIVTPNGFEPNFVPEGKEYDKKRKEARRTLINVAEKLLGYPIDPSALLVSTSGRYEYRNKGIDVFIEAMNRVRTSGRLQREVVAFIMVPAWVRAPRADLKEAIKQDIKTTSLLQIPFITHWLHNMPEDKVLNYINHAGFTNAASEKLKIIFVPCYLDGKGGIFNKTYYDMLIGMDATVYPSYYEPWGYTPLESIAFGIPTITTN